MKQNYWIPGITAAFTLKGKSRKQIMMDIIIHCNQLAGPWVGSPVAKLAFSH